MLSRTGILTMILICCLRHGWSADEEIGNVEHTTKPRLDALVEALRSSSHPTRTRAIQALCEFPPELIHALLMLASVEQDIEARYMLQKIAHFIFNEKVLPNLPERLLGHGFLGISWEISNDPPSIVVRGVLNGTAAEEAGIQINDRIIGIDEHIFDKRFGQDKAMEVWLAMAPGDPMKLTILRDDKEFVLNAVIGHKHSVDGGPRSNSEVDYRLWLNFRAGLLKIPPQLPPDGKRPRPAKLDVGKFRREGRPLQDWLCLLALPEKTEHEQ